MKNIYLVTKRLVLSVLLSALCSSTLHAQTWVKKSYYPSPDRLTVMGFAVNGKIYTGGGYTGGSWLNDFWEYDPLTDIWTNKGNLPGSASNRTYGVAFAINGKGYIGLGVENYTPTGGTPLGDLWEYDPSSGSWTQKSNFPSTARGRAESFVIDNKAYVIGGNTGSTYVPEVWEYDPLSDKWTQKSNLPTPGIAYPFVFSIGNKGYISCGLQTTGATKETYEYDPSTDKWTRKADFPGLERSAGTSFVIDGAAYCGLGGNFFNPYIDFYKYEPNNDLWTKINDFIEPDSGRFWTVSVVVNNKGYMGTGSDAVGFFNDWYEFSVPVGITNVTAEKIEIEIYPNPSDNGFINIKLPEKIVLENKVIVYNMDGKKVMTKYLGNQANAENNIKLNVSSLQSGLYNIMIQDTNGKTYSKSMMLK